MSHKKPIQGCNDFVIKFANVNGSGSASANELFARAIMGMGVKHGDNVEVTIEGADEDTAAAELQKFFRENL